MVRWSARWKGLMVDHLWLTLVVDHDGRHPDAAADDVPFLAEDLGLLDGVRVEPAPAKDPPQGARAVDATAIGSLLVGVAGGGVLMRDVVHLVADWLARRQSGTIKIKLADDELELTYASSAAQRRALEAFLDRHAA
jgi:hypothetical protein